MIDQWFSSENDEAEIAITALAKHLGLSRQSHQSYVLSGNWKGHHLEVGLSNDNRVESTNFELSQLHLFNTSFKLSRQTTMANLLVTIYQDIQIGDADFNAAVVVQAWQSGAIKQLLLGDKVRAACLHLFNDQRFSDVVITNHTITGKVEGFTQSILDVESILYSLEQAALAFDDEGNRIDQLENHEQVDETIKEIEPPPKVTIQYPKPEEEDSSVTKEVTVSTPKPEPLTLLPTTEAAYLETFEQLFTENLVNLECYLNHIVPGHDAVFSEKTGWIAAAEVVNHPQLGCLNVCYRIGDESKQKFNANPRADLLVAGELVNFDFSTRTIYIDSGELVESDSPHKATVVVSLRPSRPPRLR